MRETIAHVEQNKDVRSGACPARTHDLPMKHDSVDPRVMYSDIAELLWLIVTLRHDVC